MATKKICNMCGKEFDIADEANNFSVHCLFGYGTKYDGDVFDLDICCDCTEKVIDALVEQCKINPIEERF